jgi:hypothetical protein
MLGDQRTYEIPPLGDPRRVGVIIGLRNADGSPPYVVKWLGGGHIAVVFPGTVHQDHL